MKTSPSDLIPCVAAFAIPALSWFFSSRRPLFLKVFGGDRPLAGGNPIPEQPGFRQGVRIIALVQLAAAVIVTLILFRQDLF